MTYNLNMNGYNIENLQHSDSSSAASEAVNKRYVDEGLNEKLDTIPQADFNINNNEIINLAWPTKRENAVNKQYAELPQCLWEEQDAR